MAATTEKFLELNECETDREPAPNGRPRAPRRSLCEHDARSLQSDAYRTLISNITVDTHRSDPADDASREHQKSVSSGSMGTTAGVPGRCSR
jgi:hypothetical protein